MEIVSDSKLLLINFLALLGKCTVLLISKFHQLNLSKIFFSLKLLTCGFAVGRLLAKCEKGKGEEGRGCMGSKGIGTQLKADPTFPKSGRMLCNRKRSLSDVGRENNVRSAWVWSQENLIQIPSLLLTLAKQWSLLSFSHFLWGW